MNRRDTLKIMVAGLAATLMAGIAPRTHAAILKDRANGKKRLVFYFTATGNSLFVAKQFSDNPLSIPQELKKDELVYEADEIGFVFPDYVASAPMIVREFVTKGTFKAPYIFSVITYGNASVSVAEWWNDFAKEQGVANNYVQAILMVDVYLPVFDMNEQMAIDKNIDENLAKILEDIGAQKNFVAPTDMGFFTEERLKNMRDHHFSMTADRLLELRKDRCAECLTCADVCPRDNFSLGEDGLQYAGQCEFCLACVHHCPHKALTLKSAREGWPGERNPEARFRNPNISLREIIRSNKQTNKTV